MTGSLVALLLGPLLLPLTLLAAVAFTVVGGVNRNFETSRQVVASQARLTLITAIQKDVASLENGQRGYIITGNATFLQPYTRAREEIGSHIAQLRDLRRGLHLSRDRLQTVEELLQAWETTSAQPEIRAREQSLQAAAALVSAGQGRRQLEEVRAQLAVMQENELLRQRNALEANDRSLLIVRLVSLLGVTAGVLLMLLTAWRSARMVQASVDSLSSGARQIAAGQYDLRLRPTGVRELDVLSGQFHQMAEAVQRRERELAESTHALQQTNANLERSNRELERFAYVASHDLQEPLRTIGSYTELLAKRYRGQLDSRADQYIEFTISAAQRLKILIQDLLTFSRVHRPGRTFTAVDAAELAAQVRQELQAKIEEARATVTIEPLPTVQGNAELLHHVFLNLMTNAIKFRAEGRPPQVRLWAERGDGEWVVHVQDNGIGIEARYFGKIFEVFQRLHGVGEYTGSGIGLAVSRSAVEQHGGRLWLDSTPGVGSTFHFSLSDHPASQPSGEPSA